MARFWARSSLATCLMLGGCAGVPTLYNDGKPSAPRVEQIERQVSCEIFKGPYLSAIAEQHYFITVLLTLQVDDNVDFTPSLGFVHPLAAAMTNRTTTVSGDLGGARRRTFTATYTLDASELQTNGSKWCDKFSTSNARLELDGTLGLDEIIQDGLKIVDPTHPALHPPSTSGDKSAPSFGSYVQFIITRSLTGLGPVWTIKRFKGPGGTNGLFNAKRLDTDSLLITFAPQYTPVGPTAEQKAAMGHIADSQAAVDTIRTTKSQLQIASAAASKRAREARERLKASSQPHTRIRLSTQAKQQLTQTINSAEDETADLNRKISDAQIDEQSALSDLSAAKAVKRNADAQAVTDQAQGSAAAVNAAQTLQQTMILQNLVGALPR